jgi:hypothetical protein
MSAPVKDEYFQLRCDLLERGFSVRAWALKYSLPVGSVYNSIRNRRNGVKARQIRKKLNDYLYGHHPKP